MPKSIRLAEPVGRWLLWYAAKTGLKFCTPKENDPLISLDSVEDAIPYYRDIVKMEAQGWVTGAPGEDVYAFEFTSAGARDLCQEHEAATGFPKRINS